MTSDSVSSTPGSVPLPEGWRMVTFGEVARNVKNVIDRETCDLDRYIAGEHMKTDDLHIRKWGTINGDYLGPAFHCKFEKGQILYGSRRTYLRKVAIAPFDGICANTTFVIEPKGDAMIPEILPFLMQSEGFNQYSIQHSKGSTNPYIIWRDLAAYTFPLPPIDEQRRIAKILWAAEDVIVKNEAFVAEVEHYKQLMMRDLFSKGIGHEEFRRIKEAGSMPPGWRRMQIGSVSEVKGGIQKTKNRDPKRNPRRYLTVAHVQRNYIDTDDPRYFELTDEELEAWRLLAGDVLVIEGNGNRELVGRSALFRGEIKDCVHQNHIIRVRPHRDSLVPEYLTYFLNSPTGRRSVNKQSMGTSGLFTLSVGRLKKTEVPLPLLPEQHQIASILSTIDDTIAAARASVEASKALKMRLINQLLSVGDTV
ncbi:restriction endonuclease subunit S [Methanoculleus bourgensis]|uniref:restriction endonuclease subunit S n=1 Tax=Methanoculleus bourgensis TaxID=83986 RepID=UPI001BDA5E43|nr:restriction endonuclease subunit S [Methanoculleus bourgensis]MBT0733596.1 restriction endonuclease subunit S [Methanoculleus bourgensis]